MGLAVCLVVVRGWPYGDAQLQRRASQHSELRPTAFSTKGAGRDESTWRAARGGSVAPAPALGAPL